jgi:hypothetical protein
MNPIPFDLTQINFNSVLQCGQMGQMSSGASSMSSFLRMVCQGSSVICDPGAAQYSLSGFFGWQRTSRHGRKANPCLHSGIDKGALARLCVVACMDCGEAVFIFNRLKR